METVRNEMLTLRFILHTGIILYNIVYGTLYLY